MQRLLSHDIVRGVTSPEIVQTRKMRDNQKAFKTKTRQLERPTNRVSYYQLFGATVCKTVRPMPKALSVCLSVCL